LFVQLILRGLFGWFDGYTPEYATPSLFSIGWSAFLALAADKANLPSIPVPSEVKVHASWELQGECWIESKIAIAEITSQSELKRCKMSDGL
jgi:hypothetical protein